MLLTAIGLTMMVAAFSQQLASVSKPTSNLAPEAAAFNWTSTTFDFGKIKAGVPVSHEFTFTNSGNAALIIASVQASCGCTVTEYTKDPINPGGKGKVKATYNAAKAGQFSKTVTVNANTEDAVIQLTIKGEVVE